MAKRPEKSLADAIIAFLATTGEAGATLPDIYAAVRADLGPHVRDTSIRSVLYMRLHGAKSKYKARFERWQVEGKYRYKLFRP
jgi:hypothetical protein